MPAPASHRGPAGSRRFQADAAPAENARTARLALLLGLVCAAACAGVLLHAWSGAGSRPGAAARPAVATRLIVQGRTTGISGVLAGGVRVSGTLYPSLPGANTLRLVVHGGSGLAGRMELAATMPGMAMRPITIRLAAHGGAYTGRIRLPMFGVYRATLSVRGATGRDSGAVTLAAPLDVPAASQP